ncbi:(d)CMP kinase [Thermoanaerobacteraceae bacterium SP2]|nr:(d)CMP kinase [Thermoanaerobacteraceae bacterium SP2]
MAYNIAIDGPAGAGKSTVAKRVAERLNMTYIDTGAMYRAVTLKAHEKNKNTAREIVEMLKDTYIEIKNNKVILDGEDVTEKIRSRQVTQKVSYIAKIPEVRFIMVEMQKKMAGRKGVIMDGRDIGTTVLPDAEYKFFLTADLKERARRRFEEFKQKGQDVELEQIEKDILERDLQDSQRECSPLLAAKDAIIIDTTYKSIQEVVDEIISWVKRGEEGVL